MVGDRPLSFGKPMVRPYWDFTCFVSFESVAHPSAMRAPLLDPGTAEAAISALRRHLPDLPLVPYTAPARVKVSRPEQSAASTEETLAKLAALRGQSAELITSAQQSRRASGPPSGGSWATFKKSTEALVPRRPQLRPEVGARLLRLQVLRTETEVLLNQPLVLSR